MFCTIVSIPGIKANAVEVIGISLGESVTDCPLNLCVPVVLLRPYGLSYARPWHGYHVRDQHRRLQMQTVVAGAVTQTASPKLR